MAQLTAVILLNSPSNGPWEFEQYLKHLAERNRIQLREQSSTTPSNGGRPPSCYFFCADGAYDALVNYAMQHPERLLEHGRAGGGRCCLSLDALCDCIVGDMDSTEEVGTAQLLPAMVGSSEVSEWVHKGRLDVSDGIPTWRFPTVADIPDCLVDEIFRRSRLWDGRADKTASAAGELLGAGCESRLPVRFHVLCQMTTDFTKCMLLVERLVASHPTELPTGVAFPLAPQQSPIAAQGESCEEAKEECLREVQLERAAHSTSEDISLPSVQVLGALGGRFDHEMAVVCATLVFERSLNAVLTDEGNTIFACLKGGWTQFYHNAEYETTKCGLVNFGRLVQCETSGLLYNIAVGRGRKHSTADLVFEFGSIISVCNDCAIGGMVTIDLRVLPIATQQGLPCEATDSTGIPQPSVVFTIQRKRTLGRLA